MPLAFKAGVLACFPGKWYRICLTCFQGKCHIHCTISATLQQQRVWDMNEKLDENESFVSNQTQRVLSQKHNIAFYIIPHVCLRDMRSNELEIQLEKIVNEICMTITISINHEQQCLDEMAPGNPTGANLISHQQLGLAEGLCTISSAINIMTAIQISLIIFVSSYLSCLTSIIHIEAEQVNMQ